MTAKRRAVVLFNLGGPDGQAAVRPFLFNLFKDPAIIPLPALMRYPIAALISSRREKEAQANYALMGGGSPLLPQTERQAAALEAALNTAEPDVLHKCFIAMRYWAPLTQETAAAVKAWTPDEVVLTPLYPQYSTTTTGSSAKAWADAYDGPGAVRSICCYPTLDGVAAAHAARIEAAYEAAGRPPGVRLLFSAHGLPQKVIDGGDPYQAQIEATAAAVAARLGAWAGDHRICYQSRVGPMKWLGPSTPEAIGEAAGAGLGVVVCPIAFVSEHVETLVELDHEYAALAKVAGCPAYVRVPALGVEPAFIDALAKAVRRAAGGPPGPAPQGDWRCPASFGRCPSRAASAVSKA